MVVPAYTHTHTHKTNARLVGGHWPQRKHLINEIPTVPAYYRAKPQPREWAWIYQLSGTRCVTFGLRTSGSMCVYSGPGMMTLKAPGTGRAWRLKPWNPCMPLRRDTRRDLIKPTRKATSGTPSARYPRMQTMCVRGGRAGWRKKRYKRTERPGLAWPIKCIKSEH